MIGFKSRQYLEHVFTCAHSPVYCLQAVATETSDARFLPLKAAIVCTRLVYTGIEFQATADLTRGYNKVASRSITWLVTDPRMFRLIMKGKFDAYGLCTVTFGQKGPKLNSSPGYCSQL